MNSRRIMLVEDEESIRENYVEVLEEEGYEVGGFADRHGAMRFLLRSGIDLAILDIGLGDECDGGIVLYHDIRAWSSTVPIVFLTSHDDEADRVAGMALDIDDYISKRTSIDYLVVRIQTLFRRIDRISTVAPGRVRTIRRGELELDPDACVAYWRGARVGITVNQYRILQELAIRPGQVKSVGKLMAVAGLVVEPNTIVANIKTVRRKFREIDADFDRLVAVYGRGYRWLD